MSERMVRLDIGAQANARSDSQTAQSGSGGLGGRAAEENIDRFRRSLAGDGEDCDSSGASQSRDDSRGAFGEQAGQGAYPGHAGHGGQPRDGHAQQAPQASGAFGLFASVHFDMQPSSVSSASDADHTALLINEVADRILVSADDGREARIHIRDDVMPGVEVRVAQQDGRWIVAFIISDASSFKVLEQAGQKIADELAERLQSAVEVQLIAASEPAATPANTFFAGVSPGNGDPL